MNTHPEVIQIYYPGSAYPDLDCTPIWEHARSDLPPGSPGFNPFYIYAWKIVKKIQSGRFLTPAALLSVYNKDAKMWPPAVSIVDFN
jgi:hypothetical protein